MTPTPTTQEYSYEVRQEGSLIDLLVRCRACEGPTGLLNPACLAIVLKILGEEHYTDMITFSGVVQRQYSRDSIEYLKHLVELSKLLGHLSLRPPIPFSAGVVFPDGQIDEVVAELEQFSASHGMVAGPLLTVEGGLGKLTPEITTSLARHVRAQKSNVQRHLKRLNCQRCPFNPRNLFPELSRLLLEDLRSFVGEFGKIASLSKQWTDEGCSRCLGLTIADLKFLSDQIVELAEDLIMKGGGEGPLPPTSPPALGKIER